MTGLIPDWYAQQIVDQLERQREGMEEWERWFYPNGRPAPTPLTPVEKARQEWMEQREAEAFRLAPWLKDQIEEEPW